MKIFFTYHGHNNKLTNPSGQQGHWEFWHQREVHLKAGHEIAREHGHAHCNHEQLGERGAEWGFPGANTVPELPVQKIYVAFLILLKI